MEILLRVVFESGGGRGNAHATAATARRYGGVEGEGECRRGG